MQYCVEGYRISSSYCANGTKGDRYIVVLDLPAGLWVDGNAMVVKDYVGNVSTMWTKILQNEGLKEIPDNMLGKYFELA